MTSTMLTNLFSMFDPTIHMMNPLYLVFLITTPILYCTTEQFHTKSNLLVLFSFFKKILKKELGNEILSMYMKSKSIKNLGASKLFFCLLLFIFLINFFSLFPYIISITSHMSFNFPMAFNIWFCIFILSMYVSWKNFFSHLTPSGTPIALMSFMVLIETISNVIRPITLSVRLMANMVAGHLLLLLLSSFSMLSTSNMVTSTVFMIILGILEMGVSIIQAYVFVLLVILYTKETF